MALCQPGLIWISQSGLLSWNGSPTGTAPIYSLYIVYQNSTSIKRFYFNFISEIRKLCRKNSGFVAVSKDNSGMVTLCIGLHPVLSLLHNLTQNGQE